MAERILKGLTKQLIKECKDEELSFSKKELEAIKKTARVKLYNTNYGWYLCAEVSLDEDTCGSSRLFGDFTWDKKEAKGTMKILSGRYDTVCSIHSSYNCTRPQGTNYREEFNTLIMFMKKARKAEISRMKDYTDYVARTGDMS